MFVCMYAIIFLSCEIISKTKHTQIRRLVYNGKDRGRFNKGGSQGCVCVYVAFPLTPAVQKLALNALVSSTVLLIGGGGGGVITLL